MPAAEKKQPSRFPAISVRQPNADSLLAGRMRHDVRSRPTRFRGWILVHASQKAVAGNGPESDAERGKLLGMVRLDECVRGDDGWIYSWKSPKRFRVAIPCRGHYSIPFYVPAALVRGTPAAKVTPGTLTPKASS